MRPSPRPRSVVALLAVASVITLLSACAPAAPAASPRDVVRVPADASLAAAGDLVAPGGVILIAPGTYTDALEVHADDVTVRGEDREKVILDGELERSNGVVMTGARAAVENLTVRNFLQNGVLVTGVTDENGAGVARGPDGYLPEAAPDPVPGYLVQQVTATNNGLYGIYAFNRTGGTIRDSLASGGSDSGIYVGQCASCNAWVTGNVVTSNAAGIELANASDVAITGNRIVRNRIGISVLSNYLEAHGPTRGVQIAGNVIADNDDDQTPEHAGGAFGVGVGLGGTVDAVVRANRIADNGSVGVWIASSGDFAPTGTRVADDVWGGQTLDLAYAPSPLYPGDGNCFVLPAGALTSPAAFGPDGCADPAAPGEFAQPSPPKGLSFAKVPVPAARPGLASVDDRPRTVPDTIEMPDIASLTVPGADLLADAS